MLIIYNAIYYPAELVVKLHYQFYRGGTVRGKITDNNYGRLLTDGFGKSSRIYRSAWTRCCKCLYPVQLTALDFLYIYVFLG
jgi:hypothetical protein